MAIRVMLGARFAAAFAGVALLAAMMTAHGAYALDASLPPIAPLKRFRVISNRSAPTRSATKPRPGPKGLRGSTRT